MGKEAEEFSLDLPKLTAVELPLIVNDTDKAVAMLGGKEKISRVIRNDSNRRSTIKSLDVEINDEVLELRLRNNRFHHPIHSSSSSKEKILLKISVPKRNVPANSKDLSIRDILKANEEKGGQYAVKPVGIITKTHSFKAMSDFQVNTKNSPLINELNDDVFNVESFDKLSGFFKRNNFLGNQDYKNNENYENKDHQLPPPPMLSPIRFPYDYQYEKNPISITIKDPESGNLKVVSKRAAIKLHSIVLDFNKDEIPPKPPVELAEFYSGLKKTQLPSYSYNYDLIRCIDWLNDLLEIKPIWLRKHLENVVPSEFKRVLKQALPHVSYIFKNGPWRFCNIKYGVNPKLDKLFWIYQSEYFRVTNQTSHSNSNVDKTNQRILSNTVASNNCTKYKVPSNLIFQGDKLPDTATFHVGDIMDIDIVGYIEDNKSILFRDELDFQDGWISRQVMEVIRAVVRYKLNQLVREQPFDVNKIEKIIHTNYNEEKPKDDDFDPEGPDDPEDAVDLDPDDGEDPEDPEDTPDNLQDIDPLLQDNGKGEDMEIEDDQPSPDDLVKHQDTLGKLQGYDSIAANKLAAISELIKQESLM